MTIDTKKPLSSTEDHHVLKECVVLVERVAMNSVKQQIITSTVQRMDSCGFNDNETDVKKWVVVKSDVVALCDQDPSLRNVKSPQQLNFSKEGSY